MKLFACMLAGMLLLSGCSAQKLAQVVQGQESQTSGTKQESSSAVPITTLRLMMDKADSLNPYTLKSQTNFNLMALLYEGLFENDKNFEPQNRLAESIDFLDTTCTVKLKADRKFSDGKPITSEDIIYSLSLAISENSVYRKQLYNIMSWEKLDDTTFTLKLYQPDQNLAGVLNFPIIPNNSGDAYCPAASGKYAYTPNDETLVFTVNGNHPVKPKNITQIKLVSLPDEEAINYSLKSGSVDYLYSDVNSVKLYNFDLGHNNVMLNNLVFLGMNTKKAPFNSTEVRKAFAAGIDRTTILSASYSSKGAVTQYPFNPAFYQMKQNETPLFDLPEAKQAFTKLEGYSYGSDGTLSYQETPFTVRLLVNSENQNRLTAAQQVKETLGKIGVAVSIEQETFAKYTQKLLDGDFDLYIGEVKVYDNMDIAQMLTADSTVAYGANGQLYEPFLQYRAGTLSLEDFLNAFLEQQPFVPLFYRYASVLYTRSFDRSIVATEANIFYNIEEW